MHTTGRLWGVDHWNVIPDIMCLGKALGGGVMPLSAFVSTPEIWKVLEDNPFLHSSTFGGNPLACAVALAFLDTVQRENVLANVRRVGHYFRQSLTITLLNPKAIVFYMAFFPLFVDPALHPSWLTFAFMAATIAVLGGLYCLGVVYITHTMAERIRANPKVSGLLQKVAGLFLIGFGLKLALGK